MTVSPTPKLLICCFSLGLLGSLDAIAARPPTGDLRQQASSELSLPVKKSSKPTPAPAQTPASEIAKPYLQSVLPVDERELGRPRWTLEVGLENQSPRGQIVLASLGALDLEAFEARPAVSATLGWWFGENFRSVLGRRWRSAVAAQIAWSQHRYSLDLPGRSAPTATRLEVLRPQIGLLVEYLVGSASSFDTEFWLGVEAARGRLLQSQTSQQSDLLNLSLNKNYWELGTGLRSVFAEKFSANLQYRQRRFARQEGVSHHGVVALGLSL